MSWSGTESNFVQSDASQLHCKDTIYKGRFANKMPKKERKKEEGTEKPLKQGRLLDY